MRGGSCPGPGLGLLLWEGLCIFSMQPSGQALDHVGRMTASSAPPAPSHHHLLAVAGISLDWGGILSKESVLEALSFLW